MLQSHFEISERSHPVPGLCGPEYAEHARRCFLVAQALHAAFTSASFGIGKLPADCHAHRRPAN
jgi:hypothetical protein